MVRTMAADSACPIAVQPMPVITVARATRNTSTWPINVIARIRASAGANCRPDTWISKLLNRSSMVPMIRL